MYNKLGQEEKCVIVRFAWFSTKCKEKGGFLMPKGKSLRKYSFEEKTEVIIDGEKNGLSNHELLRKYSIPLATVRGWNLVLDR